MSRLPTAPSTAPRVPVPARHGLLDVAVREFPAGGLGTVRGCLVRFDPNGFDRAAFDEAGIACPARIAGSAPKRQAEFFHGRLAARHAMLAAGCPAVEVATGAHGEPLWPASWRGSLSHCRDAAAALLLPLARAPGGVGIDVEHVATGDARTALEQLTVGDAERAHLATQAAALPPGPGRHELLLTLAFSAKESFFKGVHARVGRYIDFDAAVVAGIDWKAGRLTLELRETLDAALTAGRRYEVSFECLPGDGDRVLTVFIDTEG